MRALLLCLGLGFGLAPGLGLGCGSTRGLASGGPAGTGTAGPPGTGTAGPGGTGATGPAGTGATPGGPSGCHSSDCGPRLGMPSQQCADGSIGGNTGRCIRLMDGRCGWEIRECPVSPDGL